MSDHCGSALGRPSFMAVVWEQLWNYGGLSAFVRVVKLDKEIGMPRDTHNKAAEHHENAAKSHRTAAEHHGRGEHAKGLEESEKARGHSKTAHEHSEMAHGKSQSQK